MLGFIGCRQQGFSTTRMFREEGNTNTHCAVDRIMLKINRSVEQALNLVRRQFGMPAVEDTWKNQRKLVVADTGNLVTLPAHLPKHLRNSLQRTVPGRIAVFDIDAPELSNIQY